MGDTSPDSAGGPMLTNQKKDKICLVCGDKALGYNFNAVSCESCKAFFRRNAHKTIRGRCEGKCDVNVESRSFCKRCRLAKCFTVGMRKDMILDDDQKKLRKQKILINKLRRHGTLPPEDTYSVSDEDLRHSYNQKIVKHSLASLKKQYPSLSAEELSVLQNIKSDEASGGVKSEPCSSTSDYEPWSEVKDNLEDVLADMDENDRQILQEMNQAHENSTFLSNTETKLKSIPTTPTEMFNIADGFVRRIIKVVKQLKMFRNIFKDDQIAMLKGSVVEIMVLRSAVNFDVKTETWTLSTKQRIGPATSVQPTSTITSAEAGIPAGSAAGVTGLSDKPVTPAAAPAGLPTGLNFEELSRAARSGADINTLRKLARQGQFESHQSVESTVNPPLSLPSDTNLNKVADQEPSFNIPAGLNIEQLSKAARMGADINTLRNMARQGNLDPRQASGMEAYGQPLNMSKRSNLVNIDSENLNIEELHKAKRNRVDMGFNDEQMRLDEYKIAAMRAGKMRTQSANPDLDDLRQAESRALHSSTQGRSLSTDELRTASTRPIDLNTHSENLNLADLRRATAGSTDLNISSEKLNLDELRNAAMRGADINTLREMARGRMAAPDQSIKNLQQRQQQQQQAISEPVGHVRVPAGLPEPSPDVNKGPANIEHLRNTAKSAGLDIDALRNAAMNGASFEDLSRMARGEPVEVGKQGDGEKSSSNISAEILKMANSETRTMFLTYSKFIRSLMKTIHGDLISLKFMIMLALFSSDRPGITNGEVIEKYQEAYAHAFQNYVQRRFPDSKNMFAQCIMKLTDLRNVNEIHTKMLLKMQVQDIEPLLVEIFDLPQ